MDDEQALAYVKDSLAKSGEPQKTEVAPFSSVSGGKSLLEEAKETATRIEKANVESRTILERWEMLKANELLGGRSSAGATPIPEKSKDEKLREEVNVWLKETGLKI